MRRFISGFALAGLPALWLPARQRWRTDPLATPAVSRQRLSRRSKVNYPRSSTCPTIRGDFQAEQNGVAVVDRFGVLCSVISTAPVTSQQDPWPGSRAIAIAKASTANDFSNTALAISTANLYASTLPGGSLWELNNSNPFNP